MFLGATAAFLEPPARERLCKRFAGAVETVGEASQGVLALSRPWGVRALDAEERIARDLNTGSWLVCSGHLYRDLASGREGVEAGTASLLLARLTAKGVAGLGELDGAFSLAWFDARIRRLHLLRDRFGEEPLFYGLGPGGALFGSRTQDLVRSGLLAGGLCPHGLAAYLTFGFVPGEATLDAQIRRVPAGGVVVLDCAGNVVSTGRWARPAFAAPDDRTDADASRLRILLEAAIARRLPAAGAGALLAPGAGPRGVAALARLGAVPPLPALDLVPMLRAESDCLVIEDAVGAMDVPLSDPGLEVAYWIAGGKAAGHHDVLMTGHGADEIFASHPSYAAQRRFSRLETHAIARRSLPFLRRMSRRLPSPDDPARLTRILEGWLPPPDAPPELGAFRWRVLLVPREILALTTVEAARELAPANPWQSVLEGADACDAPRDGLARDLALGSLAGSALETGRGAILRRFGCEARSPCYDAELTEYAARLPAERRLAPGGPDRGLLATTLPELGTGSAPVPAELLPGSLLKRWMAGEGAVGQYVARILSPESVRARGIFRPEPLQRLLQEHRARRKDHTGRLWALAVLELWLRARAAARDADPPLSMPGPGL